MVNQRGFITTEIMAYGMAGLGLMCVALWVALHFANMRAEKWQSAFNTFKAQVEVIGQNRIARNKQIAADQAAITQGAQDHADELYKALDMAYSAALARRVPNSGASGSRVPSLSQAASSISCPDRQLDATKRLEQLEVGILKILRRGDEALIRAATCKDWIYSQQAIK